MSDFDDREEEHDEDEDDIEYTIKVNFESQVPRIRLHLWFLENYWQEKEWQNI